MNQNDKEKIVRKTKKILDRAISCYPYLTVQELDICLVEALRVPSVFASDLYYFLYGSCLAYDLSTSKTNESFYLFLPILMKGNNYNTNIDFSNAFINTSSLQEMIGVYPPIILDMNNKQNVEFIKSHKDFFAKMFVDTYLKFRDFPNDKDYLDSAMRVVYYSDFVFELHRFYSDKEN